MGDYLELKENSGSESIETTDKRFILAKPNTLIKEDIISKIKKNDKIALIDLDWQEEDAITNTNKAIDSFLENNIKFGVLVDITNRNYIYLEEIIEYLENKNSKNIFLSIPNEKEKIPKFADIKDTLIDLVDSTKFKINMEGFPLCFLGKSKDHITNIIKKGIKINKCSLCELKDSCPGIRKEYIEKYGGEEIRPINSIKEAIAKISDKINANSLIYVSEDDIFYLLKEIENIEEFWKLVNKLGYPIALAMEMIDELEKEKVVSVKENKIILNKKLIKNENKIKDYSNLRLCSDPSASQLTVEQQDIEKRIEHIIDKCPTAKSIIFLGDDDFLSLSMASKNHFERITVLEFDERIIEKIKEISKKEGYDIEVIQHDLRKRLPERLTGKFDVFFTDSPYSMSGFTLFLSRGIGLLKNKPKKHGFASFSCEMPELEMVEIPAQNAINKMKLFIEKKDIGASNNLPLEIKKDSIEELRKKLVDFKELSKQERWYLGALARKEYLFHFLTTNQTRPLIKGDFYEELYFTDYALNFYVDNELKKELKKNPVFNWKNDRNKNSDNP